jgi:two-component sensor histidine kinase
MALILNVDDNDAQRYVRRRILTGAGHTVRDAATGGDALAAFDEQEPDLVLLDMRLPDMSGTEVCAQMKERAPTVMVLQISATYVGTADRVRSLNSGADVYLTEPVGAEELVASVRALLRIRAAEADRNRLLEQQVVLMRELQHRVRNHLQLVASLLSLQVMNSKSPDVKFEMQRAISRIRSVGLLHSHLYGDADLGQVDLARYVADICEDIKGIYSLDTRNITLVVESDPVVEAIDRATPIGLIVNEAITNALKHAFAGRERGTIRVTLRHADGKTRLSVADDGVGIAAAVTGTEGGSGLGAHLLEMLTKQINGTLRTAQDNGTVVEIAF